MRCLSQKKLFVILIFNISLLFLFGCLPSEKPGENITEEAENFTQINETIPLNQTLPSALGPCTAGWKCVGKWYKAYQYQNCSWSKKVECPLSCFNDSCQVGQTCSSGFKCIDEYKMGYQTETCLWLNTKKCDWGCQKGECLPKPENYTEETVAETAVEEPAPAPQEDIQTLKVGEEALIKVGEKEYSLKIYNIDFGKVVFKVDGSKSDWINEGSNFTYRNDFTLYIKEILFQTHLEGIRSVSYIVK